MLETFRTVASSCWAGRLTGPFSSCWWRCPHPHSGSLCQLEGEKLHNFKNKLQDSVAPDNIKQEFFYIPTQENEVSESLSLTS